MLRLIFGGFGSGKSRRVLDMIGECTAKKSAYDKSIYLIVPEQDTVRAELEAASTLAPKTALRCAVSPLKFKPASLGFDFVLYKRSSFRNIPI